MADITQSDYHIHISSQHRWFQLNLKEVWQYRDLIYLFTKRSFVVSYKQTILGPAWIFLTPLFSSIVQAFVFGEIAGIETDGVPVLLFYLCSNAIWTFFSTCLINNANTFTENAYVFGKVYFPRLTMPISNILSCAIRFGIQMILVLLFMVYFLIQGQVAPHWAAWILIPLELVHLGVLGMGFGIIVSSMTTKYRDLGCAGWVRRVAVDVSDPHCLPLSHCGGGVDEDPADAQPGDHSGGDYPLCGGRKGNLPVGILRIVLASDLGGGLAGHNDFQQG